MKRLTVLTLFAAALGLALAGTIPASAEAAERAAAPSEEPQPLDYPVTPPPDDARAEEPIENPPAEQ